ncbi:hypothetical protein CANTEDRAFT_115155 [Yamadazyma tenuis ATCC 10573]|uniref:Metallo-dependent hydrolase n=1 Tax=Candida tenuis (strain ATCC 10573 / BCRC 21748 / CBS 615 / JCM 9827 / NBRC 10315 / NRRL Y-1498 / VKM Y-70) TaxID=590646 RepID=G3B7Z3_CANTC|nr:uncharacterized protein CANTEDRAFT_115155 [Yamadazyma tenuis ATCC 10573]EGV62616.1 hypothetical protein CANTEDRAFT_115155 [Yamadazyma tenuis ATCC 10573]
MKQILDMTRDDPGDLSVSNRLPWKPQYFDIGVNFSDPMFQGLYNHSTTPKHPPDLPQVIQRAHLFNVSKMLVTASTIKESQEHFELCDQFPNDFYSTVGVHPCTVAEEFYIGDQLSPQSDEKLAQIKNLVETGVQRGTVKAFGEIGLDYDRLHYSSKEQQITMFRKQLEVIASLKHLELPLFLHMRNACEDFIEVLRPFIDDGSIERGNGVVHSFTGTEQELEKLLQLGFYIGINGCSLKSEENLQVARLIPKHKLMIETDAPWCEIRKSHAGYKYLTPYPNKFFPETQTRPLETHTEPLEPNPEPVVGKTKQQPTKKQQPIKMDDFLPFPSIKKENFEKYQAAAAALQPHGHNGSDRIGQLASPLFKSRNEPVFVGLVAEILCKLHGYTTDEEIETFIDSVYQNSCKLFKV